MNDKTELALNQLASNTGIRLGQLEGEKALLQVELNLAQRENQVLKQQLEELRKEDENVSSN